MNEYQEIALGLLVLCLAPVLYFIPTYIATKRNHIQVRKLFWINLLVGWMVFVWVGVLIWSIFGERQLKKRPDYKDVPGLPKSPLNFDKVPAQSSGTWEVPSKDAAQLFAQSKPE